MSSSESEDSGMRRRRDPPPQPALPLCDPKKKKKKRYPPQDTINKIWSRFSVQKFSKATNILPFAAQTSDPAKPHSPRPNNLLVSEDYDRAVQECRARVKKLVRECKRVNMRYRDPDFDIDWDLKWEKGYCLNGLGDRRFDIDGRAFSNPTSNTPKAVKRVHEIFEKPITFDPEKASPADVKQGSLGDCWLMASLTALANMEGGVKRICVEYDTKIGIYGFVFHRDGEWIISIIDDKLYLKSPDWDSPSVQRHLLEQTDREDVEKEYRKTYQTGSQSLFFAQCRNQNETWLPLLEKAYAKAHGDYAALAGGWIGEGVEDLTGGVTIELLTSDILDTDDFWDKEITRVNHEFLFGCSTGLLDGGYGTRDGISEGHAYVLMEARTLKSGKRLVKLRNPWGKGKKGNWEGAWSDGSKEFTPEVQQELNHKFGNDSVFWISYEDLLRKYQHFDRTRLFQDSPDWRITQKWISCEVPWKAEYEQKFRIVLKKESPIVLVLSQLDDRYFDGLQGQYNFRLQFRLHEVNSPDEDDYIVRSHGNYLMERSVVAELATLKAGTYSVFILVSADRDLSRNSVEDVVKRQTRHKIDNDKLAQVGVAYDIAHAKGAIFMESKITSRKAKDKAKAREARIATRRKNWERRHLQRDIMRKQDKKNREKREKKEAKDAEKAKEEEENDSKDQSVQTEEAKEVSFEKEDKGIQTEDITTATEGEKDASSTESDTTVTAPTASEETNPEQEKENENDKAVQTDFMSACHHSLSESHGTPETPKSSSPAQSPRPILLRIDSSRSRDHGLPPPPPPPFDESGSNPMRPPGGWSPGRKGSTSRERGGRGVGGRGYITSEGESSASPISEFDDMYSDDDPTLKPRPVPVGSGSKRRDEDEDEDEPEPWNAVAIVGFRVYSKDEGIEVKIYEDRMDEEEEEVEEKKKIEEEKKEIQGCEADVDDEDEKKDNEKTKEEEKEEVKVGKDEDAMVVTDQEKQALGLGKEEVSDSDPAKHIQDGTTSKATGSEEDKAQVVEEMKATREETSGEQQ